MQRTHAPNPLAALRRAGLPLGLALLCSAPLALAGQGYGSADADADATVAELFQKVVRGEVCAPVAEHVCDSACTENWRAGEALAGRIVADPAEFDAFAPLFRARFDDEATSTRGRDHLLRFLGRCRCAASVGLAEELLARAPEAFGDAHLIAFAGQASERFVEELERRVRRDSARTVLPAAFLAMHGDPAGRQRLVRACEAPPVPANVASTLIAAAALDLLDGGGETGRHLQGARERVHAAALAALDAGDLAAARDVALAARLVTEKIRARAATGYGLPLNNLETDVAWTLREAADAPTDADQVFDLIEEIRPIS